MSTPAFVNALPPTKTDPYSTLTVSSVGYFSAVLLASNKGTSAASFRIRRDSATGPTTTAQTINAGQTWTCNVTDTWPIAPGNTYKFMLERSEAGAWVAQIPDSSNMAMWTSVTTPSAVLGLVSTSPTSLTVSWPLTASAVPAPEWSLGLTKDTTSTALADAIKTMSWATVPVSASGATTATVTVNTLSSATKYAVWLCIKDRSTASTYTPDKFAVIPVNSQVYATTALGALSVTSTRVSYAKLSWTGNATDAYRVVDTSNVNAIVATSTGSTNNFSYKGLAGGKTYKLSLQRTAADGSFVEESTAQIVTPSTTMSITSVGSTEIQIAWGAVYDGAMFEVHYGTSPSTMKVLNPGTALTATITNLAPNSTYAVELYVIENNSAVGVAALSLGTDKGATPTTSSQSSTPTSTLSANVNTSMTVQKASVPATKHKLSGGAIAGIVISVVVVCAVLAVVAQQVMKKRRLSARSS